MQQYMVDIIIPTYKPDADFRKMLLALTRQSYPIHKIIIMNTEEAYWDSRWIEGIPEVQVHHIAREAFDHGGTRDAAAKYSDGDIMVFLTQDALPADTCLIEELVSAFREKDVKAAYARQLPAPSCSPAERYARLFNYPDKSSIKRKEDLPFLGIKTFFCSNVCAAYERNTYDALGGFIKHTIFNEDMIYAGNLIQADYGIAYVSKAKVIHSHNYGIIQQFKRNFDLAVSQADHPEIFAGVKSEKEGIHFVKSCAAYLVSIGKPWLILHLVIQSGFKFLGYRLGKLYCFLPRSIILKCTMNQAYWTAKL